MENKMDSLFKKKLENNSLPPRENAWARVESGISKKNKFPAWRIAAALLLAGALITVGIFALQKKDTITLAQHSGSDKLNQPASAENNNRSNKDLNAQSKIELKETLHTQTSSHEKHAASKSNVSHQIQNRNEMPSSVAVSGKENMKQEEISLEQYLKTDATSITQTSPTPLEKPIVLEFTLEEVVADQTAVAKTETKNSGLKKMLEAARQIKNGEGPMNQLLEKKDELFALNFKKEKQKTQH